MKVTWRLCLQGTLVKGVQILCMQILCMQTVNKFSIWLFNYCQPSEGCWTNPTVSDLKHLLHEKGSVVWELICYELFCSFKYMFIQSHFLKRMFWPLIQVYMLWKGTQLCDDHLQICFEKQLSKAYTNKIVMNFHLSWTNISGFCFLLIFS